MYYLLFTLTSTAWDGREKLVLLLSSGVHALEVVCTIFLPVVGVKCLFYTALGRGAFGLHTRKFQNMLSLVHVLEKEFSMTAKLLSIAQPSLEDRVPPNLSISCLHC